LNFRRKRKTALSAECPRNLFAGRSRTVRSRRSKNGVTRRYPVTGKIGIAEHDDDRSQILKSKSPGLHWLGAF